jgi:hypothetical protein
MIIMLSAFAASVQTQPVDPTAIRLSKNQIAQIVTECRMPRSWLLPVGDGTVRFNLPATAKYKTVACAIRLIRPHLRVGFVGNERR